MPKINRSEIKIIFYSLVLYVACYLFMYTYWGVAMSMCALIVVVAVGWHLGLGWGILAGLLSMPLNILLAASLGIDWRARMIALFPGTLGMVFIGAVVGHMSSLRKALKAGRDNLNRQVLERTADLTRSNEILKAREQELSATNLKLRASEQQLQAAMQQLEASNEQLIAGEKEIKEAKEFLEKIFQTMTEGMLVLDETGYIIKANRRAAEILGRCEEDLLSRHLVEFICQEKQDMVKGRKMQDELFEKGYTQKFSPRMLKKNGEPCLCEMNLSLLKNNDGEITGSIVIVSDISERKRAEKALRESEERLELSYEATNDGLWEWNIATEKCFFSPRYYTMLGYEPYELPPSFELWQQMVFPEDLDQAMQKLADHLAGRSAIYEQEFRMVAKTGEIHWILARGRVIEWGSEGQPVRMIGVHTDITERKQSEAEKQKLRDQLHQTQKMEEIGTLAGGIAHDFNNILGVISGYTEMSLDQAKENAELKDYLMEVLTAAGRAKNLVEQILTFSRQTDQERKPVAVKPVIQNLLKFIRACFPTTITIRSDIRAEHDVVLADATQIHQVIMNLCTNARHAMQEAGGVLEIVLTEESPGEEVMALPTPGNYLKLKISDTGCGMDAQVLRRIFDPFFTTKEQGQGSGLGLSVVHGIVKSYGGVIQVASEPGEGTEFRVYLPLTEQEPESETAAAADEIRGGTEHIFLVDDEEIICEMTQKILEKLGYTVTVQTSSTEALKIFRKTPQKFDLVLTDQTMPGLTGAELSKEMLLIRSNIPIIISTGYSEDIYEEKALNMGIRGYLAKPIVTAQLAEKIRQVLDQSRAA